MARSLAVALSGLTAFALFSACGGVSDSGLFSPGGGAAGSSSLGGSAQGGSDMPAGGAATAGANTGGAAQAGASAAGASSGGAAQGGASSAGAAGAAQAGTSNAGSGGAAQGGAGGAPQGGAAGSSAGGSAGGGELSCSELLAQASKQLEAARACNNAVDAEQCTGQVKSTCNCDVPVERANSTETNAYLATLKQIEKKKCVQVCPALACLPANHAVCQPTSVGSATGKCTASFAQPL